MSPRGISGPAFAALRRGERQADLRFRQRAPTRPSGHPPSRGYGEASRSPITRLRWATARRADHDSISQCERASAFTLLELLVVIGIVALLMALVVPAFTTIKSGGDATSAAYTIKGVLDTARTYAKANNTYVWVGFFEEDGSIPSASPTATPGNGRIVMSIVASKDGSTVYSGQILSPPVDIETTPLSKCRIVRHDSRRAAF